MIGGQRLFLCVAEAEHAVETYLNEHVFTDNSQCKVVGLNWQERAAVHSDAGPALVVLFEPADEISAGREAPPAALPNPGTEAP